jgi:hypothetical protein
VIVTVKFVCINPQNGRLFLAFLKRASHTDNNGKKLKSKYKVTLKSHRTSTKKAKKEGKRHLKRKDYLFLLNIEVDNTKDSFSVFFS